MVSFPVHNSLVIHPIVSVPFSEKLEAKVLHLGLTRCKTSKFLAFKNFLSLKAENAIFTLGKKEEVRRSKGSVVGRCGQHVLLLAAPFFGGRATVLGG